MKQTQFELYEEIIEHLKRSRKAGLDDFGLLERVRNLTANGAVDPSTIMWKPHKSIPKAEVARYKNFHMYLFCHDYYYEPEYRCIIIDGEELMWSDNGSSSERMKLSAERFLKNMGVHNVERRRIV